MGGSKSARIESSRKSVYLVVEVLLTARARVSFEKTLLSLSKHAAAIRHGKSAITEYDNYDQERMPPRLSGKLSARSFEVILVNNIQRSVVR